jgi:hypothetical protein
LQTLQTKLEAADKAIQSLKKVRQINGNFATKNNLYTNGENMLNQATADNLMNPEPQPALSKLSFNQRI